MPCTGSSRADRRRSGRAALLLVAFAAAAALVALLAAFVLRGGEGSESASGTTIHHDHPPGAAAPAEFGAASDSASPDRTADPNEPPGVVLDDPYRGHGEITLTAIDRHTGAPLVDLPIVVWSERPQTHVYTRGVTDEAGRLVVRELPEDVVVFESARHPPHANTVVATWLRASERKELLMQVGRGGTVRGRAVDDLGDPIEGVFVTVDPRPGGEALGAMQSVQQYAPELADRFATNAEVATRTSPDGRFEVEAILSRPGAIWIEGKEMAPRREDPILVQLRHELHVQSHRCLAREAELTELGDVLFERARTYCGRVVDRDHEAVSGALVSVRSSRHGSLGRRPFSVPPPSDRRVVRGFTGDSPIRFELAPWEPGFELAAGESVTDALGRFELVTNDPRGFSATVYAETGAVQTFPFPGIAPGTRSEDLELVLAAHTDLLLEIIDENGQPLPERSREGWTIRTSLTALAVDLDGGEHRGSIAAAGPTTFGARFEVAPDLLASLHVAAPDHEPASIRFESPPTNRPTIPLTLVAKPRFDLRLRLRLARPEDAVRLRGDRLMLLACAFPPDLDAPSHLQVPSSASASVFFAATMDATLVVPAQREWIVVAHGPFVEGEARKSHLELGRFEPRAEPWEVELPPVSEAYLEELRREKLRRAERESKPEEQPPRGTLTMSVVDASTATSIGLRDLGLRSSDPGGPDISDFFVPRGSLDVAGARRMQFEVAVGRYEFRVFADGYRPSGILTAVIEPDRSTDLGSIALEPLPRTELRLLRADGAVAGAGYVVEILDPGAFAVGVPDESRTSFTSDGRGVVTLRGDLGKRVVLSVGPSGDRLPSSIPWNDSGAVPAAVEVAVGESTEPIDVPLPRWRDLAVMVRLASLAPELRDLAMSGFGIFLIASPLSGPGASLGLRGWARRSEVPYPDSRRFHLSLPEGRYTIRAEGGVIQPAEVEVLVSADGELPEIVLEPRSR